MQRPDCLLVLTRKHLDRAGLTRVGRQPAVHVAVGAQNMREHRGVAGIRLPAGLFRNVPDNARPRAD
jgi:hypothetical protein